MIPESPDFKASGVPDTCEADTGWRRITCRSFQRASISSSATHFGNLATSCRRPLSNDLPGKFNRPSARHHVDRPPVWGVRRAFQTRTRSKRSICHATEDS